MATRSKPATTVAAKPVAKPVAKPAAKPAAKPVATPVAKPSAKPARKSAVKSLASESPAPKRAKAVATVGKEASSLRFYLTPELQIKVDAVLALIERSPEPATHGEALADLVVELTDAGMYYFYLRALKSAQVGFVVEQSARLALSGASSLISSVCRRYLVRMDDAQLAVVVRHIRELAR